MLSSAFYLAPLLIYFPRLVPGVETQPLATMALSLLGLFAAPAPRQRVAALLVTLTLAGLALLSAAGSTHSPQPLSLLQLLAGPLVFLGAIALRAAPPTRRTLRGVTAVLCALAAFELAAPQAYSVLGSLLLDRVSAADGHRGISLLNPEPTYAAISIIYVLVLTLWSRGPEVRTWWLECVLVALLALTLSTYAAILLAVLAAFRWPRLSLLVAAGLALSPLAGNAPLANEDSFRAVVALSRLIGADFGNFLTTISAVDESLGARILSMAIGVDAALQSQFGFGLGCDAMPNALRDLQADYTMTNPLLLQILDNGCLKPPSYLTATGLGLGRLGFIYIAILAAVLLMAAQRERRHFWMLAVAIGMLLITVQAQITNPVAWMLFYFGLVRAPHQGMAGDRAAMPPASPGQPTGGALSATPS